MTRVTVTADGSGVKLQPDWMHAHDVVQAVISGIYSDPAYVDMAQEIAAETNVIDTQPWQTYESVEAVQRRNALLHDLIDELRLDTSIRLTRIDGNCLVADLLRALAPRIVGTGGMDAEQKNGRSA